VKAFLEKHAAGLSERLKKSVKEEGRKSNSYLFTGGGMEDLMKVLDAEWQGGIPHTLLVDPDGKVLWRHSSQVNGDELRAKVLERLGTVWTQSP